MVTKIRELILLARFYDSLHSVSILQNSSGTTSVAEETLDQASCSVSSPSIWESPQPPLFCFVAYWPVIFQQTPLSGSVCCFLGIKSRSCSFGRKSTDKMLFSGSPCGLVAPSLWCCHLVKVASSRRLCVLLQLSCENSLSYPSLSTTTFRTHLASSSDVHFSIIKFTFITSHFNCNDELSYTFSPFFSFY